jgi:hypothetical protein
MKNKLISAFCSIFVFGFVSLMLVTCATLNLISAGMGDVFTPNNEQMISALREALKKGAENAGAKLSVTGAFNNNPLRKIPLPPEAQPIINNISKIPGGQQQIDALILRINTAAENASKKIAPIFGEAITSMTISDAANILKGSNTAATEYLERTTTAPLKNAFRPELNKALSEPIIAGISAQQAWTTLITNYNAVANSAVGKLSGMKPVNTDINEFVLGKALTAIFTEMADVEKNIRANPVQFLSDVSTKVFNWAKR